MKNQGKMPLVLAIGQISEKFDIFGKTFKLYSATDVDGLEVKTNGGNWEKLVATQWITPDEGINSIQFNNISGAENTLSWAVWNYKTGDDLTEFTSSDLVAVAAQLKGSATFSSYGIKTLAALVQQTCLAANADRVGCVINSNPDNAIAIYVGFDDTVNTTNKYFVKLNPGGSIDFSDYRGAIHIIATGAAIVSFGEW